MLSFRAVVAGLALVATAAWAQPERPRVAWIAPGPVARYQALAISPDGAARPVGGEFGYDWISLSPTGLFAAWWKQGEAAIHALDVTSGADRVVPDLAITDVEQVASVQWSGDTLWLQTAASENRPSTLWAVSPRVPAAVAASGTLAIERVFPAADGSAAYALARSGGDQIVALCFADGRAPRLLCERQRVAGGTLLESGDRIALLATRTDRAGSIIYLCDRDSGQEIELNPEAGAFQPTYSEGFRSAAYSTREGIVVQSPGGEARLVHRHLPDRRFALSYRLTPSGDALLVEVPVAKDSAARVLLRYGLTGGEPAPVELARIEDCRRKGGSLYTFSDDGASLLIQSPLASDGWSVLLGSATGPLSQVATGVPIAARFAPSGQSVALVMVGADPTKATVRVVATNGGSAPAAAPLTLAARERRGRFEALGLGLEFAPGGERLLVAGLPAEGGAASAWIVEGETARQVAPGATVARARWAPSGTSVLLDIVVGWLDQANPLISLESCDAATGVRRVLSGAQPAVRAQTTTDGGATVVSLVRAQRDELMLCRTAREALRVNGDASAAAPLWSPDGQMVAFTSPTHLPGLSEVWVARPETLPVRVSGELRASGAPVWSPDSTRLFFSARRSDGTPVGCLAALDGSEPRDLGPMGAIRLLPDASGITYRAPGPPEGIWRMRWADPRPEPIAEGRDAAAGSPDGVRVLVARHDEKGYAAEIAGPGGARIVLPNAYYRRLVWSPSGTHLAAITEEGPRNLVIVDLEGKQTASLAQDARSVAWSPSGDRLAAIVAEAEGRVEVRCWTADGTSLGRGSWPETLVPLESAPSSLTDFLEVPERDIEWSPDGKAIVSLGYSAGDGYVYGRVFLPETDESFPLGATGSLARLAWSGKGSDLAALTYPERGQGTGDRPLLVGNAEEGRLAPLATDGAAIDSFAWLPDGRLCYWARDGEEAARGTFVSPLDGAGAFRVTGAAADALWPRVPEPTVSELRWAAPARPTVRPGS